VAGADGLTTIGRQFGALARRSIIGVARQPGVVIPPFVFPLLLFALVSQGLASADRLPGFRGTYRDFAFAIPFAQGAIFAATIAGTNVARDIQDGFLRRLAMTPMRRIALLTAHVAGAVSLGAVQAVVFSLVGIAIGIDMNAGLAGWLVLIGLAIANSLAFASLGALIAVRTGSTEAVQGLFPVLFALLTMSTLNLPLNLITVTWFHDVAAVNPISHVLDALRSLIIEGWEPRTLVVGFLAALVVASLAMITAARLLRSRMPV
jgi:ABC-2 type transport system permease protein